MIPVLGVPVLNGYELLGQMLASVDEFVVKRLIVDNGGGWPGTDDVLRMPGNIGVSAAWNLIIRSTPWAPWWFITNHDIVYAPGDLARLVAAMEGGAGVATLDGFAAFGISRATVEAVGYFDENFYAYVGDCDYEWRCRLAGVDIVPVPFHGEHRRSSTIAHPHYAEQNARTYPEERRYFAAKWGGDIRGGEVYETPFDSGADPSEWTLDHRRLVALHWRLGPSETAALVPDGYERR